MSNENVPYLCVGVLFVLLKQTTKIPLSSRQIFKGVAVRHSDPKMMEDLVIALRSKDNTEDGEKYGDPAFKTTVSKYVNCISNAPKRLPFTNSAFASSYEEMVKMQYPKAIEQMQKFVQGYVDPNSSKWLVKAILYIVDRDTDISDSDQFFISPDGTPKSKEEIRHMDKFCLPAVLVGVMNYILINRGKNNKAGATTLEKWGTKDDCGKRNYDIDSNVCFDREIEVLFECPQTAVDMSDQETETVEEVPVDEAPINTTCTSNEIYDRLVLLESKITEFIQSISTRKVASIQLANIYAESTEPADTTNQTNTSTEPNQGAKLYEYFKTEIQDALVWLIEHDPSAEMIARSLPCTLADLSVQWRRVLYKIKDDTVHEIMIQTLDLLDQYAYYLSDEFMRVLENQDCLIARNQSWEEGEKLRDILQPQVTELRYALLQQYNKLYKASENDQ